MSTIKGGAHADREAEKLIRVLRKANSLKAAGSRMLVTDFCRALGKPNVGTRWAKMQLDEHGLTAVLADHGEHLWSEPTGLEQKQRAKRKRAEKSAPK